MILGATIEASIYIVVVSICLSDCFRAVVEETQNDSILDWWPMSATWSMHLVLTHRLSVCVYIIQVHNIKCYLRFLYRHGAGVINFSNSSILVMHSIFCFFSSHFLMVGRSKYSLLPWRINWMSWHLTVRYTADFDLPSILQTSSTLINSPSSGCGCCFSRTIFSSASILSNRFWMSSGSCSNDTTFVSILLLFFSEFILSIGGH